MQQRASDTSAKDCCWSTSFVKRCFAGLAFGEVMSIRKGCSTLLEATNVPYMKSNHTFVMSYLMAFRNVPRLPVQAVPRSSSA